MIVNPKDSEGHFLLITIGMEYKIEKKSKLPDELTNKITLIIDAINGYLSTITLEQLSDTSYRKELKRMIKKKVNRLMVEGKINKILFAQFVIQ